jgi:hypothetical protein
VNEPRTKAAQRLLGDLLGRYGGSVLDPVSDQLTKAALLATEAEAYNKGWTDALTAAARGGTTVTDKAPTTEPRTEAGRALLGRFSGQLEEWGEPRELAKAVLAIEAEAATPSAEIWRLVRLAFESVELAAPGENRRENFNG